LPSPSSAWLWLARKEWRELVSSRAWWILLLLIGPLVGVTFTSAVQTYAEASGLGGSAAGVGEAFSPLIGIWAPTFSACEIAAAFLLPFVAIRLVAGDKQSGALKLEMQGPISAFARIATKALALFAGWLLAMTAPAVAVLLWHSYGGNTYPPELLTVVAGHLLNAGLIISLAALAAAITEHPATAAIVVLSVTVGSWILSFIAAVQGGFFEAAAAYTPTALVAQFQHGLVRLDVVLIALVLMAAGLCLAGIWIRTGTPVRRRARETAVLAVVAALLTSGGSFARASWDFSENRTNSFSQADERALRQINAPVRIEVHLAAQDPRRSDLDRRALDKLRRVVPKLEVHYISATSIGLFEQSNPDYGEVWYSIGERRVMSRAITPEAVLESIYSVAGVAAPGESGEELFRGHPLAVPPRGAAAIFYGAWPAAILLLAVVTNRRSA
jgi:ABC-type transport system involved in multi-copper enzyme maturation permease subunit